MFRRFASLFRIGSGSDRASDEAVDPKRWRAVRSADLKLLHHLRKNGDRPHIVREIDLSFLGPLGNLQRLAEDCARFGFSVRELLESDEEGQPWLFLARDQTADEDAIRNLTVTYLQIEDAFGVQCNGWGCEAQVN